MLLTMEQAGNIHNAKVIMLWAGEFNLQYVICETFIKILDVIIRPRQTYLHSSLIYVSYRLLHLEEICQCVSYLIQDGFEFARIKANPLKGCLVYSITIALAMDIEPFNYFDLYLDIHNFSNHYIASSEIGDVEQEWNIWTDDLVSAYNSPGGTWEGPSTNEPEVSSHHPFLPDLIEG